MKKLHKKTYRIYSIGIKINPDRIRSKPNRHKNDDAVGKKLRSFQVYPQTEVACI